MTKAQWGLSAERDRAWLTKQSIWCTLVDWEKVHVTLAQHGQRLVSKKALYTAADKVVRAEAPMAQWSVQAQLSQRNCLLAEFCL